MQEMLDFVAKLPKAELHMHIEGALEPELMIELGKRNGIELPWADAESARRAYRFDDLQGFLNVFYRGLSVLISRRDFEEVTGQYLERARNDNIVHAELFLSPQAHLRRGVGLDEMLGGVFDAIEAARLSHGMSLQLILLFQRHLPESDALEILESIIASQWRDRILGFGLAGAELPNPPSSFQSLFARCRELGFHVVAHAGEEGPADFVRDSIDLLKVERIDHGVQAEADDELVERLAALQIPLTICPTSNVKLGVYNSLSEHNFVRLLRRNILVTLNTDDPAYFGAYLGDVLAMCIKETDITKKEAFTIVENGFKAAFLSAEKKQGYLERLKKYAV